MGGHTLLIIIVEWAIEQLTWLLAKGTGALVTIIERKTRFSISIRVSDKSAKTVTTATTATIALLTPFKRAALMVTADNGKEFANHEKMTERLRYDVYLQTPIVRGSEA
jgi:IS30 family transposase